VNFLQEGVKRGQGQVRKKNRQRARHNKKRVKKSKNLKEKKDTQLKKPPLFYPGGKNRKERQLRL